MTAALSHTTLVIVVVCASVVGLVVAFIFIRLILRSRNLNAAAPLPPVQPLAHRRPTLYPYDASSNSRPTSTILSTYSPGSAKDFDDLAASHLFPTIPTLPSSSESLDSTSPSHNSFSRQGLSSRPLSQVSFSSNANLSVSRRTSRNTFRGAPHAPHNQVQIILPTPLAFSPQHPQSTHSSLRRDTDSDHVSLVDRWVPVGRDDTTSSLNLNTSAPSTPRTSRRFSSISPSSHTYLHSHIPPPIPQIFTMTPDIESQNPQNSH